MNARRFANPAFLVSLLVMSASAIGMKTAMDRYSIYLQKRPIYAEGGRQLRAIPTETEHWRRVGQDLVEGEETLEALGTDNYLTRVYQEKGATGKPRHLQLHAAYYTGMIDTVPHVPERCMTGAGMTLVGGPWTVPVPMPTGEWKASTDAGPGESRALFTTRLSNEYSTAGGGRRVNLPYDLTPDRPISLRISEYATPAGAKHFAGYLFIANGGWVSSAEGVRLLAFNLTDDYAYYLKVQIGSPEVNSPEELAQLAGSLLGDLLGEVMTCVPDWPKVERAKREGTAKP